MTGYLKAIWRLGTLNPASPLTSAFCLSDTSARHQQTNKENIIKRDFSHQMSWWLNVIEVLTWCSSLFYFIICWRLLCQIKGISFINLLFLIQFSINCIVCCIFSYFFIKLGRYNFYEEKDDSLEQIDLCKHFFSFYVLLYTLSTISEVGIYACRFVYVRFAQGLLTDKGRLFHRILMVSITTFSFQWIIIWQIQQLLSSDDKGFRNMIKGKICNKEPILKNWDQSLMPKIATVITLTLWALTLAFLQQNTKKHAAKYAIPKVRGNLITISQHSFFLFLSFFCLFGDQLVNILFEWFFNDIGGVDGVFNIWWFWNLFMFGISHIFGSAFVLYCACKECPEFIGLRGKPYPGTEKPRRQSIVPRRQDFVTQKNIERSVPPPSCDNQKTMPKKGYQRKYGSSSLTMIDN